MIPAVSTTKGVNKRSKDTQTQPNLKVQVHGQLAQNTDTSH